MPWRAKNTQHNQVSYNVIPSEINDILVNVPIAINLYYGDPFLKTQVKNTYDYLIRLKGHKGPIIIITKGDISKAAFCIVITSSECIFSASKS